MPGDRPAAGHGPRASRRRAEPDRPDRRAASRVARRRRGAATPGRGAVVDAAARAARDDAVTLLLGFLQKSPCANGNWTGNKQYTHFCYSDVVPLWSDERLDIGAVPYRDNAVEYPVLTGGFMWLTADLTHRGVSRYLGPHRRPAVRRADLRAARDLRAGGRPPRRARRGGARTTPRFSRCPAAGVPRVLELGPARDGVRRRALWAWAREDRCCRRADRAGHRGQALSRVPARPDLDPGGRTRRFAEAIWATVAAALAGAPSTSRSRWPTTTAGGSSTASASTGPPSQHVLGDRPLPRPSASGQGYATAWTPPGIAVALP